MDNNIIVYYNAMNKKTKNGKKEEKQEKVNNILNSIVPPYYNPDISFITLEMMKELFYKHRANLPIEIFDIIENKAILKIKNSKSVYIYGKLCRYRGKVVLDEHNQYTYTNGWNKEKIDGVVDDIRIALYNTTIELITKVYRDSFQSPNDELITSFIIHNYNDDRSILYDNNMLKEKLIKLNPV